MQVIFCLGGLPSSYWLISLIYIIIYYIFPLLIFTLVTLFRTSILILVTVLTIGFLCYFWLENKCLFSGLLSQCVHLYVRICIWEGGWEWIRNGYSILWNTFWAAFSMWWNVYFHVAVVYGVLVTCFLWSDQSGMPKTSSTWLIVCLYVSYIFTFGMLIFKISA